MISEIVDNYQTKHGVGQIHISRGLNDVYEINVTSGDMNQTLLLTQDEFDTIVRMYGILRPQIARIQNYTLTS